MMIPAITSHFQSSSTVKYWEITKATKMAEKAPPKNPSHDFLGDTRSKSLVFPNRVPAK